MQKVEGSSPFSRLNESLPLAGSCLLITFDVTRERIRQIERHTLKKLESVPEAQALRDAR